MLRNLTEGLERLVERVLTGIGIEPSEDVGGGILLELDGGDETQHVIPVLADQRVVDVTGRSDFPVFSFVAVMTTKEIQPLLANALDAGGRRKSPVNA